MGGGTAANLEYLGDYVTKIEQIHVVDLSQSLLNVGRERVARNGWTNVHLLHEDATTVSFSQPVDVVTFSYSLTMIPNWYLALENARRLLRPGGIIAVADFYVARKHPVAGFKSHSAFTRWFWPAWFSCDNVFPSPDHLPYLHQNFDTLLLEEKAGKLKFFPFARVPYYLFMGRKSVQGPQSDSR
jgi:S-adenosylmethionine-diacylgycerolhomoserine-N-methlytransferase